MAVGSESGTTHLDVLYLDQLYVGGSITGSVIVAGTESITQVVETNISAAGTITGSVANVTTLNCKGSQTGSVLNVTTLGVKGTTTGSFLVGTHGGDYLAASIPASGLKKFSVIGTSVGTANGSYAHGLAAVPAFVSIVPRSNFTGATGTEGCAPYVSAALNATDITVVAGTAGTIDIFALA